MFKLPFSLIPTKQLRGIARVFFGLSDKIKGISFAVYDTEANTARIITI